MSQDGAATDKGATTAERDGLRREDLIGAVEGALRALSDVDALWEAGSASFGRVDRFSDVDLLAVAAPEAVDAAFTAAEAALAALSPIAQRYEVPPPTWHGHRQVFYRLEDAGPYLMVDLAIMARDGGDRFLGREQHGEPRILFDRAGVTAAPPFDRGALLERLLARRDDLVARFALFQPLVAKAVLRGDALEAIGFYHALTLRPLVELLRMRHDPARAGFGLRYLREDLPAEEVARLEALAYPADLATLGRAHAQAEERFHELAASLDIEAAVAALDEAGYPPGR